MSDLDTILARLAAAPVPAAMEGIENRVLARIAARPAMRRAGLSVAAAITISAMAIGIVGADLPVNKSPSPSLAPLGGPSPLAPSVLLGEP